MGWLIDMEQKGCESSVDDHDIDFSVTIVRCMDVPDSDWGDFRCQHAIDISSCWYGECLSKIGIYIWWN